VGGERRWINETNTTRRMPPSLRLHKMSAEARCSAPHTPLPSPWSIALPRQDTGIRAAPCAAHPHRFYRLLLDLKAREGPRVPLLIPALNLPRQAHTYANTHMRMVRRFASRRLRPAATCAAAKPGRWLSGMRRKNDSPIRPGTWSGHTSEGGSTWTHPPRSSSSSTPTHCTCSCPTVTQEKVPS
jgi:hypothetical protein